MFGWTFINRVYVRMVCDYHLLDSEMLKMSFIICIHVFITSLDENL